MHIFIAESKGISERLTQILELLKITRNRIINRLLDEIISGNDLWIELPHVCGSIL